MPDLIQNGSRLCAVTMLKLPPNPTIGDQIVFHCTEHVPIRPW